MTDSAIPTNASSGAQVADVAKDESLQEVAAKPTSSSSKGKGKAVEEDIEDDDDDDEDDDDDSDEDEEENEDGDDDLDEDIEADEVDPTNISAYGIGNRPSRRATSKPIDYSSEEALQKAGISAGGGSNDDEEDDEFKADVSMDG